MRQTFNPIFRNQSLLDFNILLYCGNDVIKRLLLGWTCSPKLCFPSIGHFSFILIVSLSSSFISNINLFHSYSIVYHLHCKSLIESSAHFIVTTKYHLVHNYTSNHLSSSISGCCLQISLLYFVTCRPVWIHLTVCHIFVYFQLNHTTWTRQRKWQRCWHKLLSVFIKSFTHCPPFAVTTVTIISNGVSRASDRGGL